VAGFPCRPRPNGRLFYCPFFCRRKTATPNRKVGRRRKLAAKITLPLNPKNVINPILRRVSPPTAISGGSPVTTYHLGSYWVFFIREENFGQNFAV
jgi:hypothetical protein